MPRSNWAQALERSGRMVWATAAGAVLVLLALLCVTVLAIRHEREQAFARALDINAKLALSDEVRIRSRLASLDKVMLVLRKDFADRPTLSHAELLRRLQALKVDDELEPRLSFVNAQGVVVLSSAPDASGQPLRLNVADRAYFQKQATQRSDMLNVDEPIISRVTGKWIVPLTRRVVTRDGAFGGIVSMAVEPGLFTGPFEKTSMDQDGIRAIIGRDGLARLRLMGQRLVFGGDARQTGLFEEIKKAKVGTFRSVSPVDGVERLVTYRVMDPFDIIVLAGSSLASIEDSYRGKVLAFASTSALFAVLTLLLSGLLIRGNLRQKRLMHSQHNFQQLIGLMPQLVSSLDASGNILWVNQRMLEFVGPAASEQALGLGWVAAAVHPDDRKRVQDRLAGALSGTTQGQSCDYRKRRADGQYLWFSCQITPVLGGDGTGIAYLQTATDIHDRKMAQERARVTQKLESIGQLTGGMAHDFNNLLAIIVGNLDLLKDETLSQAGARRLEVSSHAAQRGVALVKALLALASKQPLLPTTVDLWALVERIAPLLQHALGKRVQFELSPPQGTLLVEVDEAGLEAALLNLVMNARDAMPAGGLVTLGLQVRKGQACIRVVDSGVGMSEQVLKRATEPFFTTKQRDNGTGLGLSMVAGFVEQSGGSLDIQSALSRGTAIEILLPLSSARHLSAARAPAPAQPAGRARSRRLLIVDDEPSVAELVRVWATEDGHLALVTHSADAALELLATVPFDALLTDISMPGQMDGIALAEAVSVRYPALQIMLMSGYSRETATHRSDVPWPLLVKPFDRAAFDRLLQG